MADTKQLDGLNVTILCQYFAPEGGAASGRMDFFRQVLIQNGANVNIITSMPNYPEGIIHKEYKGKLWSSELGASSNVYRVWAFSSPNRSAIKRLANYFSFMIMAFRWIWVIKKSDVVIFSSGPMFAGFSAFLAKKIFGIKLLLDARDLWPDRIWESGAIKLPKLFVKLLYGYEQFMYTNSDAISCVTNGVCAAIQKRLKNPTDLVLVRNCDQEVSSNKIDRASIKSAIDNIQIVEAGTQGWAQDPGNLCNAFKSILSNDYKNITLKFAGSGPRASEIVIQLKQMNDNASYLGNLSKPDLWRLLFSSDIGVVTLKSSEHNMMTVSRRVFDYARAGLAIIYAGAGEGADIVRETGAGIVVPPGDSKALELAIIRLISDKDELLLWKGRSARLLQGELSQKAIGEKLMNAVARLCNR